MFNDCNQVVIQWNGSCKSLPKNGFRKRMAKSLVREEIHSEDESLDTLHAKGLMIVAHTKFNNSGVRKRTGKA
jgi:hypothetical protein